MSDVSSIVKNPFDALNDDYFHLLYQYCETRDLCNLASCDKRFDNYLIHHWNGDKSIYRAKLFLQQFDSPYAALAHASKESYLWLVDYISRTLPESLVTPDARGQEYHGYIQLGTFPLMMATRAQNLECVEALIRNKANVDEQDHNGRTILMLAATYCSEFGHDLTEMLLEAGADISLSTHFGQQAILYACLPAKPLVVNMLLDHKAEPRGRFQSSTPLHRAVEGLGMLKDNDPVPRDIDEIPWACDYASRGYLRYSYEGDLAVRRVVAMLILHGADPMVTDESGKTVYGVCEKGSRSDFAQWIRDFHSQCHHSRYSGSTARSTASSNSLGFPSRDNGVQIDAREGVFENVNVKRIRIVI